MPRPAARQSIVEFDRPARERVQRHRLDNGLQVVLQADSSLPLVTANLTLRIGSRDDPPGRSGLAHLCEHLFFQGSQNVAHGELLRSIQLGGGRANGSTWFDLTSFHATFPAHQMEVALWLDSDRLGFFLPALSEERFETQRRVVLNERRRRFDNQPYGRAYERLHEILFPEGHPYRCPVIGYPDHLQAIDLAEAREVFQSYYAADNGVLTVVGDLDPERTLALVASYFAELPARSVTPPPPPPAAAALAGRRVEVHEDVPLARVYLAFPLPGYPNPPWYAADMACEALTRGRSSLLSRELVVERQLAQEVTSFVLPTDLVSVFVIAATCKPGVPPESVEELLLERLDDLGRVGLDPAHHQRALNRAITEHYRGLQSSAREAENLSRASLLLDDPEHLGREPGLYAEVGREEIARCARDHLRPEAAVVLVYLPRSRR